jgi:mannose-6-phosphate isomerase-like protein (cupin superfamily)
MTTNHLMGGRDGALGRGFAPAFGMLLTSSSWCCWSLTAPPPSRAGAIVRLAGGRRSGRCSTSAASLGAVLGGAHRAAATGVPQWRAGEEAAMHETMALPPEPHVVAPDGCDVRVLLGRPGGTFAHFSLAPGAVSVAVRHRSVEEIWYFLGGEGVLWRDDGDVVAEVAVRSGTCVSIPVGTAFQLRGTGGEPLAAVAVTMPPWPGDGEAERADGPWTPTLTPGPGLADA